MSEMTTIIIATPAIPPTTPPTIAPTCFFSPVDEVAVKMDVSIDTSGKLMIDETLASGCVVFTDGCWVVAVDVGAEEERNSTLQFSCIISKVVLIS
jgi:hypothetical protein